MMLRQQLIDDESFIPLRDEFGSEILIDVERAKTHTQIQFDDIYVYFPHEPYEVQKQYMAHVIKALNRKENALLQSPTGTGKTLSLLCSSLAWLAKKRAEKSQNKAIQRILYASRTHAQLKQVAKELKESVYQPKFAVLGSRDQLCIKRDLLHLQGAAKNMECKKAVKQKQCPYFKKETIQSVAAMSCRQIMDIEDLKKFGSDTNLCPYYFERARKDHADLMLIPYNYLLEKDFVSNMELQNCIVIFDEAHNIQNVAEEGYSLAITDKQTEQAANEIEEWIAQLEYDSIPRDMLSIKLSQCKFKLNYELKDYRRVLATVRLFGQFLTSVRTWPEISEKKYNSDRCCVIESEKILDMVISNLRDNHNFFNLQDPRSLNYTDGLKESNIEQYITHLKILTDVMSDQGKIQGVHVNMWANFISKVAYLFLEQVKIEKGAGNISSFKNPIRNYSLFVELKESDVVSFTMCCLDPSIAFKALLDHKVHNILLTSGTLTPFDSWEGELRMPFPIQLNNGHVIDINQSVRAYLNQTLDFSYQKRNNEDQMNALGQTLYQLTKVIPNGILFIFSSYKLMYTVKSIWSQQAILQKVNQDKKCFWEPSNSREMTGVFDEFKVQAQKKGAILFAVQRGKITEGIDFSDELCRAVFLVGVPYPPKEDRRIREKMNYLDAICKDSEFASQFRVKSSAWYSQQAIRSTNQAVGRVIRHIKDYGYCED